ncbi:MAG TPA: C45 family autoproteolytic acyltransferase/hydrolase [Anaerolineae bacterium]|nr:C45 family autoproteolytic acyltransferase/hydrolase [Anaerolineae bacterium]
MAPYRTLTLSGDPFMMGRQHGEQVRDLRPHIVEAMAIRFRQVEEDEVDERFRTLLYETRMAIEWTGRPLLEMIRGQAEALDLEFETLLRYDLISYLRDELLVRRHLGSEGCTTWAASGHCTRDHKPILVKNRDYRPEHLPLQCVVRASPSQGYRYTYISSAGSPGVFSAGINQAGLAVADTHVYSSDLGPGLPDYAMMMHLLEHHARVAPALDYLRSIPRLGRNNLILADETGHLAVFESGHNRYGLFEVHGRALVNTNHYASAEMQEHYVSVDPPEARGRTFRRHGSVSAALQEAWGTVDVAFAQNLMASHDGPLSSLCCHPEAGTNVETISASIFLPAERKLLFCHGLPCRGHYDEYSLAAES